MKSRHTLTFGFVLASLLVPRNLPADEPRSSEIPQAAAEAIAAPDEQIEQITREYRQKFSDLEAAYKAEIKQVREKHAAAATGANPAEAPPTAGASVVIFTQFRPNAAGGPGHVLHILTSDGKSTLIPYEFLSQNQGNWRRVPNGIEYTWKGSKGREWAGSALIEYDLRRRAYSHPNAKHDELVNAFGNIVAGDPSCLVNGDPSKDQAGGESD